MRALRAVDCVVTGHGTASGERGPRLPGRGASPPVRHDTGEQVANLRLLDVEADVPGDGVGGCG